MTINEYQQRAMATLNPKLTEKDVLINSVMGLCGESGEAIDIVKKWLAPAGSGAPGRRAGRRGVVSGGGGHGAGNAAGGHPTRQSGEAGAPLPRRLFYGEVGGTGSGRQVKGQGTVQR